MVSVEKILTMFMYKIDINKLNHIVSNNMSLPQYVLQQKSKNDIIGWIKLAKPFINFDEFNVERILTTMKPYRPDVYNLLSKNKAWLENQISLCRTEIEKL